jgi:uncharacterized protein (TIGR02118 family)
VIKLIGMLTRRGDMAPSEFQRYWRDVHAPLIAAAPGLRRYVQSHALLDLPEDYPQVCDGIAEAWFDDIEAYVAARASGTWQAAAEDAPNFIASSARLLTRDVPVIDAYRSARERESMVKYVGFLTRKPGLSVEQFQRHWREVHAPLVVAELTTMVRYVQSHALPETYGTAEAPAFDGTPQAWFESMSTYPSRLGRRSEGPPTSPASIDSHKVFIQPIPALLCREITIVED